MYGTTLGLMLKAIGEAVQHRSPGFAKFIDHGPTHLDNWIWYGECAGRIQELCNTLGLTSMVITAEETCVKIESQFDVSDESQNLCPYCKQFPCEENLNASACLGCYTAMQDLMADDNSKQVALHLQKKGPIKLEWKWFPPRIGRLIRIHAMDRKEYIGFIRDVIHVDPISVLLAVPRDMPVNEKKGDLGIHWVCERHYPEIKEPPKKEPVIIPINVPKAATYKEAVDLLNEGESLNEESSIESSSTKPLPGKIEGVEIEMSANPKDVKIFVNGVLDALKLMEKYPLAGICSQCNSIFAYVKDDVKPGNVLNSSNAIRPDGTFIKKHEPITNCQCKQFSPRLQDRRTGDFLPKEADTRMQITKEMIESNDTAKINEALSAAAPSAKKRN